VADDVQLQIIFDGSLTGEFDLATTKHRFANMFNLPAGRIDNLFTGNPQIIKLNLSESAAMKLAFKIAEIGCECVIEPMPDENDLSLQPGFVERRKISNRRQQFRRGPRAGAIIPDRRSNNGRRKTDPEAGVDIYGQS
jgi:hypothetical protein